MQTSVGNTWLRLSIVDTLSCATVSLLEMVPLIADNEKTLKTVHTIVSSRPSEVAGTMSPKPKVLMLTNAKYTPAVWLANPALTRRSNSHMTVPKTIRPHSTGIATFRISCDGRQACQ